MGRESSQAKILRMALTYRRYIGDVFRALPDRTLYPDYYETIPEPESLDNISVSHQQGSPADDRLGLASRSLSVLKHSTINSN